jgi:hypothetical protein
MQCGLLRCSAVALSGSGLLDKNKNKLLWLFKETHVNHEEL